jgi:hypothetical protein
MSNLKTELLICECNHSEHQMIIRYFEDDEYPQVYVDVCLNQLSFFKRLILGIKYIFGYNSKYGVFDEFIMNETHINQLENVIKHIKKVEGNKLQMKLYSDGQTINI